MAYERLSDSLFEKYSSSSGEKGKVKSKKTGKKDKPVLAEYFQLPRDNEPKPKKKGGRKKKGEQVTVEDIDNGVQPSTKDCPVEEIPTDSQDE